ncbi:MFS transporter [Acholeplasma vituli]|uniref:MFS transporter n=1 Tax=Paracholeplasma vituli TaxID=69473 RepID=A0ABT2PWD2_9MOLU|nr:MFS transporter [Paracholeplasma vituli]MCU0105268.1 MFS transporter [Paracholeplasma vituli]
MHKAWLLLAFSLLVGLGMNLAHPVTPAHLDSIGINKSLFGVLFASMNLGQFIFAPIWGNLGDQKNRTMVAFIGILGYAISQLLFGYFTNVYLIILVRFTAGIFACAILSNGLAHISVNPAFGRNKAKLISLFVAFNVIGSTLGYYIGGTIGDYFVGQESVLMYIQAGFNILLAIFTLLFIRMDEEVKIVKKRQSAIAQLLQIKELSKELFLLIIIIALVSIAQTNFSKYLDMYITDLGYMPSTIGTLVFTTGMVTLLVSFLVVPYLNRHFKETKTLLVVVILQAVFTALTFGLNQSHFLLWGYTFFMVYTAGKAIYEPAVAYHLSKYTEISPGVLMGSRQSAISLGAIIGPLIAGLIYDDIGVWMFIVLSGILGISAVLLFIYNKRVKV